MAIINRNNATPPSAASSLQSNMGIAPEYLAILDVSGTEEESFTVTTPLSENFSLRLGSQWVQPFNKSSQEIEESIQRLGEKFNGAAGKRIRWGGVLGSAGMAASGIRLKNQLLTAQMWESSDPMSLSIPFTLQANKSAKIDVMDKVAKLLKCVAPRVINGAMMAAPGPTLVGTEFLGRKITLSIGKFLVLDNCIIRDVDAQLDSIIGEEGLPMKAVVNISVESFFGCFTTQDIDKMFKI